VVIGPSPAGLRAVEAARRSGFDGTVRLVGAEPHLPCNRPPLSKRFLTGAAEPSSFRAEASLRTDLDVDVRLGAPATALDADERVVVAGGEEIGYAGLVIATGARARELPGMPRLAGVHTLLRSVLLSPYARVSFMRRLPAVNAHHGWPGGCAAESFTGCPHASGPPRPSGRWRGR
jgi:NADPH-dependent 2,4-dienoyl-CoA reductase/sulfur reductase-like enzyme